MKHLRRILTVLTLLPIAALAASPAFGSAIIGRNVTGPTLSMTPDVMWAANDIGAYDPTVQQQMQSLERSWGDPKYRS